MEAQITKMIEDEVQRRLEERLTKVLEHISKIYDVSMKQLLKDTSTLKVADTTCMGMTNKGSRCRLKQNQHGYCKIHQSQRPIHRPLHQVQSVSDMSTAKMNHNHPSSVLWQDGCPGCKKNYKQALMIEI